MKSSLLRFWACMLVLFLAACGAQPLQFKATDVTGSAIGGALKLKDHNGRAVSIESFKGKVVVVFFGYTHCPDICPTTMADLGRTMKQLGTAAANVQVLFVSLDPERDSPAILSQYVPAFHPSFLGLTGSLEEIQREASAFKVVFQKSPGAQVGEYTVDHSTGSYVFDKTGRLRLYVSHGAGDAVFSHDISLLLNQ
ncbi:SCO family protein [Parachitinimonas caeni]|uniref:SCO family protein n=1 Tax=Parachitinimonas caeni TaxID=3031301 RepID=A0ABT7DV94_9NEIS|nr:SCO family protein [Parachitinimonas caeni]MDK2123992.1 SCO family protein [Parachitinimonas caeni]